MKVLLVGGFLGSGKTTVILRFVRALASRGGFVAIIENEIGKVGIDQDILGETEVSVTPLFGGCVCCQLAGDILTATTKIHEELDPDILIVETTGVAVPEQLIEVYRTYGEPDVDVQAICIIDSARWNVLLQAASPLVTSQLQGIDAVVVNKEDVNVLSSDDEHRLVDLAGGVDIIHMSAANATDDEVYALLAPCLGIQEA